MYENDDDFIAAFRVGAIEPAAFDHRAHLRAAVCALVRLPFLDACVAVRDGLGHVATKVGKPGLYHETMTVAMLALVADALEADGHPLAACDGGPTPRADRVFDVDGLVARHPALVDRRAVADRYRPETFDGDAARRRFRLPDADGRR